MPWWGRPLLEEDLGLVVGGIRDVVAGVHVVGAARSIVRASVRIDAITPEYPAKR